MDPNAPPALPPLFQAELDDALLDALFADLADGPVLLEILVRGPVGQGQPAPWTLARAHAALKIGEIRAVQLRYTHDGAQWWDTLTRQGERVRLVRVQHPITGPGAV